MLMRKGGNISKSRLIALATLLASVAQCADLHVAAAANLSNVMADVSSAFEKKTGTHVVPSYGATAQLTQQIENGAPFDVFLSADTEHVDQLIKNGALLADSRAVYARGRLVVWCPQHPEIKSLNDLTSSGVRHVAIATPSLAPYGAAAVEVLKKSGLWDKVEPKVVYAPSIAVAKQYADTGNAEAAFTAFALTVGQNGSQFTVDEKLHSPIDQAAGIARSTKEGQAARAFMQFVAGPDGRAIFKRFGYIEP
jgi:molybdate transport system substrate-binding protein